LLDEQAWDQPHIFPALLGELKGFIDISAGLGSKISGLDYFAGEMVLKGGTFGDWS